MALSRVKTWTAEELTSADLNAEFDNILNNATSLISPLTANLAAGGYRLTGLSLGSSASPSVQFTGDTDTGVYSAGANSVSLVAGATASLTVSKTIAAGGYLTGVLVSPLVVEAASGTHPVLSSLAVFAPTITGDAATVTNGATLYVSGPTTGTVSGANYSLFVDAGNVRFDGEIFLGDTNQVTLTNQLSAAKLLIASQAAGDILYADTTTSWARLAKGSDTNLLTLTSGVPAWVARTTLAPAGTNSFRLIKSGANLTLSPIAGNTVDINGTIYQYTTMPTLAATDLTPDTDYYIYLYDNSGTATLEASATGYTVDTTGRANKTGDATRRLMGMARVITGPAWADSENQRFVLSRDNRRNITATGAFSGTTSSATLAETTNVERSEFLAWADSSVLITVSGYISNASATGAGVGIGVDSATVSSANQTVVSLVAGGSGNAAVSYSAAVADGYHYATAIASTSAGTLTLAVSIHTQFQG